MYDLSIGSSVCTQCPIGYYCDATVSTSRALPCPQGFYCPAGSTVNYHACPSGTYGSRQYLQSVSDCTACTAGSYCSSTALTAPQGQCGAGYFCPVGSTSSLGATSSASSHVCPAGTYCPAASLVPTACPPGTYQPGTGRTSIKQCLPCMPGSYCGSYNLTAPSGLCSAGYYCTNSSTTASPLTLSTSTYGTGLLSGKLSRWLNISYPT